MTEEEVDILVEVWHDLPELEWADMGSPELHEFLGWTEEEYAVWFETGHLPKE